MKKRYGAALVAGAAAGVPVRLEDVKGTCHGFDTLTELEISRTMAGKRAQALKGAFEGAGQGPKDGNGYQEKRN